MRTLLAVPAAALLLSLACPPVSSAQGVIYALVTDGYGTSVPNQPPAGPTTLVQVPLIAGQPGPVTTVATLPGAADRVRVSSGGRFVLWSTGGINTCVIALFDAWLGTTTRFSCVEYRALADPVRERLFLRLPDGLHVFSAGGLTAIPQTGDFCMQGVSRDGLRLFGQRGACGTTSLGPLEVLDVDTGVVLRTTPGALANTFKAMSDDESRVYVVIGGIVRSLLEIDAGTGIELRRVSLPAPGFNETAFYGAAVVDSARERFVLALGFMSGFNPPTGEFWTADLRSMTEVSRVFSASPPQLAIDTHAGAVYGLGQGGIRPPYWYNCSGGAFDRLDVSSGIAETVVPLQGPACLRFDMAFVPPAPALGPPVVTGNSVTLSWVPEDGVVIASRVEAGSGPGLSNLAVLPVAGGQTTVTVPNVPPGTYYVRVRALNHVGASAASNEVMVVVL